MTDWTNFKSPGPNSASAFLRTIERAKALPRWTVETVPAEHDDPSGLTRVVFRLAGTEMHEAYVAFEFGRLIVTLDGWYHFELNRLHEDLRRGWSWQQQIEGKSWCGAVHLNLLDELCVVLPPSAAAMEARRNLLEQQREAVRRKTASAT